MTVRDAERLARLTLGSRITVDRNQDGWVVHQWGLTDSGYRQERVIGQHKEWDACFQQAIGNRRQPWGLRGVGTMTRLGNPREGE